GLTYSINVERAVDQLWVSPMQLLSINTTPVDTDGDGETDEAQASSLGDLTDLSNSGAAITGQVTGLTISEDGQKLYGILRDTRTGEDRLILLLNQPGQVTQPPEAGTPSNNLVGYSSDESGLFYSIFSNGLLNDALYVTVSPSL